MGTPQKDTLEALWEVANRAQDQVVESISALDSKAGTLVDFSAIVTGLYLVAGIGIPDLAAASCIGYRNLAFASLVLGVGSGIAALLVGIGAWRLAKIKIFDLPAIVRKLELEPAEYARSYVIGQLSYIYAANVTHYDTQKKWVRRGIAMLAVSVGNVGAFIILAALTVTSVCA